MKRKTKADRQKEIEHIQRRIAELEVERGRILLGTVIETVPDIIFVKDRQGRYLMGNAALCRFYNKPVEEMIGKDDTAFAPPDVAEYLMEFDKGIMTSGEARTFEEEVPMLGRPHTYLTTKAPYRDREGNVIGVIGIARDITERKKAEEKLQGKTAILNSVNEVFKQALTCDSEEQLGTTCLAIAERLSESKFGFLCEINEQGLLDTIAISNPGWSACNIPKHQARKKLNNLPIRGIRGCAIKDGRSTIFNDPTAHPEWIAPPRGHPAITCFMGVPVRIRGNTIGLIGLGNKPGGYTQTDREAIEALSFAIAEALMRKWAEGELRQREEQYRTLVKNIPGAVYRAEGNPEKWSIRYFSDAVEDILGYPASDFIEDRVRTYVSVIHPEDAPMVEETVLDRVGKYAPFELEYRVLCADGGIRWVNDRGQGFFGEDGELQWLDGVVHDITERKKAEEAIRAANQQLQASEQQLRAANQKLEANNQQLRATEQQLRKSKALLNATGRMAKVGGWELEAKSLEVKWTEQTYRIHEVPLDHKPPLEEAINFFHPDDRPKLRDAIQRALEDGEPYDMETRFITAKGKHLWTRTICEPQVFDGKTVRLKGTFQDITERKEAQEALEALNRQLGAANQQLEANNQQLRAIEQQLRASNQQLEASNQQLRAAEAELRKHQEHLEELVEKRTAELVEAQERYKDLFDSSTDGIVFTNMEGRILNANRAYLDMLGYTRDEIRKLTSEDLTPEKWHEMEAEIVRNQIAARGFSDPYEKEYIRKNGETFPISIRVWLIRDSQGEATGMWGIVRDITERKRIEENLRQYASQLEAANKELEAFAYSVSHDLRAPLRRMDGFSQALLRNYGDVVNVRGKHYLERIRVGAKQMAELIDDLLELSRLTRVEMRREKVGLSALAHSVADEQIATEPARTVDLAIHDDLTAEGDRRLLGIVLENLLGNAWKFTRKVANARIEFGAARNAECGAPNAELPEDTIVYFVRDNGAGFDMEYADKLFGTFQRLHSAGEYEGTGVGLATVQRIIHRHGGRVWAEGEPGRGATFYFTL
jgi:PAS domain S-box-containing protein